MDNVNFKKVANIVKDLIKKGYSKEEIRKGLLKKGWKENQVKSIFKFVKFKKEKINKKKKLYLRKNSFKFKKLNKQNKIKTVSNYEKLKQQSMFEVEKPIPETLQVQKPITPKILEVQKPVEQELQEPPKPPQELKTAPSNEDNLSSKLDSDLKSKKPIPEKEIKVEDKNFKFVLKESGRITETNFDKLVNFVNQAGAIKISTVAKIFNISIKKIEEWARILENHNLLQLHYPPIGEPELRKWKK